MSCGFSLVVKGVIVYREKLLDRSEEVNSQCNVVLATR